MESSIGALLSDLKVGLGAMEGQKVRGAGLVSPGL